MEILLSGFYELNEKITHRLNYSCFYEPKRSKIDTIKIYKKNW